MPNAWKRRVGGDDEVLIPVYGAASTTSSDALQGTAATSHGIRAPVIACRTNQ